MFIQSLFTYVGSMIPFLNRSEIQEDLTLKIKSFDEHVVPSYIAYTNDKNNVNFKSNVSKALNEKFYRLYNLPKSGPKNFIFQLKANFQNFRANLEYIKEAASKDLEATTSVKTAPAKKAAIIKAISEMTSAIDFSMALLSYILDCEMVANSKDINWATVKAQEDKIQTKFATYVDVMNVYCGDPKKFSSSIASIPDITIDSDNVEAVNVLNNNPLLNFLNTGNSMVKGFLGNPIYHLKMNNIENKVQRYNCNKELKKSLELKVMWLSEDNRNNPDPELEAEIQYLNNNIAELQYEIDKMEQEV